VTPSKPASESTTRRKGSTLQNRGSSDTPVVTSPHLDSDEEKRSSSWYIPSSTASVLSLWRP